MVGKFELFEAGGEYRWQLRDARGALVAQSQGYIWKADAVEAIETARSAVLLAEVEDLTDD